MTYVQVFKSLAGVQKRCAFENAHCNGRYRFYPVKVEGGWRMVREVRNG